MDEAAALAEHGRGQEIAAPGLEQQGQRGDGRGQAWAVAK